MVSMFYLPQVWMQSRGTCCQERQRITFVATEKGRSVRRAVGMYRLPEGLTLREPVLRWRMTEIRERRAWSLR